MGIRQEIRSAIESFKKNKGPDCGEPPTLGQTTWEVEIEPGLNMVCRTEEEKQRAYNPSPERVRELLSPFPPQKPQE